MRLTPLLFALGLLAAQQAAAQPGHGLAMHGEPALNAGYAHLPYADPSAPKGGRIDYGVQGTFDSLNPFIVMGDGARGIIDLQFGNNVFDTLMMRSQDEPFTLYPLVAKTVETDDERSFVEFTLDEKARFSDGEPIKPEDVIFTFELLRDKGFPRYANSVNKIARMEKVGTHGVRLTFAEGDRELPLILGLMPVLPSHAIDRETFDKSSLKPMIGSGPYLIERVRPGELVVLKRDPGYWARDHPSKRGMDNYDEIRINYFRDANTLFEAFKKGLIDVFLETDPLRWATGYDFPAATSGRVLKAEIGKGTPSGMYGVVLNTRRPVFADRRVRMALGQLFDFEWTNRNLFAGAYERTRSYFDGSELSSHGVPASDAEKALLAAHPDAVLPEIASGEWTPAVSDGSGRDRDFLREGYDALIAAGCRMEGQRMLGPDGRPLAFEIMLNGSASQPVVMVWQRTLARLGIALTIRSVDSAQFLQRQRVYDFDAMLMTYTSSLSPGVEQVFRWGSAARDHDGTYNFAGVAEPAVDAMIQAMLTSRDRDEFVAAVRAFDRLLLSGAYVVPFYHQTGQWVAHWSHVGRPAKTPVYGMQLPAWWDKRAQGASN